MRTQVARAASGGPSVEVSIPFVSSFNIGEFKINLTGCAQISCIVLPRGLWLCPWNHFHYSSLETHDNTVSSKAPSN